MLLLLPSFQTTSAQIPMLEFRNHVCEVLRYYADRGVTWQISGWYKPGLRANDEQVREPKFHVTCVTPERVLENAPLFNVIVPDVERQVLQAAVQRPCHQRVLAPHQQRPQPNPDAQQQRQQPQAAPQQQRQQHIQLHNSNAHDQIQMRSSNASNHKQLRSSNINNHSQLHSSNAHSQIQMPSSNASNHKQLRSSNVNNHSSNVSNPIHLCSSNASNHKRLCSSNFANRET